MRHPDPDKDHDTRRQSEYNLQFLEIKRNFSFLSVAFIFSLQRLQLTNKWCLLFWVVLCYNIPATAMVSYESGQVGNEAALRKLYHVR